jgi:GNAT superfamily N-acetyltransferase
VTTLRRATPADAALLARHRAAVWIEVGDFAADTMAAQEPVWTAYLRDALAEERYVAWIAVDDGDAIVGSGAVLIGRAIPRPGSPSDLTGRVHSVYIEPHARRRGIARAIMAAVLEYAREHDLISLTLHPSDEGRQLYTSLGFVPADEMVLRLTPT